ncbi:hypothetical protein [Haladaptatus sp. DJG-WS-42]|uniref:DUF7118 family protein n=1 Tax=Haladaptatus sp. DJG-WS-42 TaxID=3120516 RepID=UPI0030D213D6
MDAPAERLQAADAELQEIDERIAEIGRQNLDAVADAYKEFSAVLDRYEDRATDRDDFQGYIEFREQMAEVLGSIPDDLPHRDAFTEADDELTTGVTSVLKHANFDRARSQLEPAREYAELRSREQDVQGTYRDARSALQKEQSTLETERNELERLKRLGEADLDAPVSLLREPIEAYNDAVAEAFDSFTHAASARAVLDLVAETTAYPLVEYRPPPENLHEYVHESAVGEESLSRLLDLAGYSSSKLDHYVENPQAFRSNVATNQSYLSGLSATPLQVSWPPVASDALGWHMRERIAVVGRFATDEVVALARAVRDLGLRDDYERLRTSATARESLSETDRTRLRAGEIERDLTTHRASLDSVREILATYPPLGRR